MKHEDVVLACAQAAHEANRTYCIAIGDSSQVHWEEAPEWQKKSAIEGVNAALSGATPEQLHELWCASKLRDGWKYGPEKDPVKKTHHCLVPYSKLPIQQQRKDSLFHSTVKAMSEVLVGRLG